MNHNAFKHKTIIQLITRRLRYAGYRSLITFLYGKLGRGVRTPVPSCIGRGWPTIILIGLNRFLNLEKLILTPILNLGITQFRDNNFINIIQFPYWGSRFLKNHQLNYWVATNLCMVFIKMICYIKCDYSSKSPVRNLQCTLSSS